LTANMSSKEARVLAACSGHRYNPRHERHPRALMEVNERMTANWAGAVVNTLLLAFFVVIAIGIALGVYAARALKKAERAMTKTE